MSKPRSKRYRALLDEAEEEPLAGVANLFDVAMAFSVALLAAFAVGVARVPTVLNNADRGKAETDLQLAESRKLPRLRESQEQLSGRGQRLGMAYRLESGEIVYVPQ